MKRTRTNQRSESPHDYQSFLGIDPGKSGAMFLIGEDMAMLDWEDCPPSEAILVSILEGWKNIYGISGVCLEKVHAMPGQGVTSMFTFGMGFGTYKGVLAALHLRWALVTPQAWQKGHKSKSDGKHAIANTAARIFPGAEKILYGPKGGLKDGRADALMIAYYARQFFLGNK